MSKQLILLLVSLCSFQSLWTQEVLFQVDMGNYPLEDGDVVYVTGGFDGWCGTCLSMGDDDGDLVYSVSLSLSPGEYEYKFVVNDWMDDPESFSIGSSCDYNPDDEFPNRGFNYPGGDLILDVVCFSSCTACPVAGAAGCTDTIACNYDAQATLDDGTCNYAASGYDCNGDCLSDYDGDGQCDNAEFVYIVDDYPTEFAWQLIASNGDVVAGAGAGGSLAPAFQYFYLAEDCYTLTVTDDYGDGICCAVGNGSYTLIVDGEVVAAGGEFEFEEVTTFCTTTDGCPDPEACNFSQAAFDNGSSDLTPCVFPDASNCEICVDGSAVSLGINADGDCNAACSNPFASNYNEAYSGTLDECDNPESDLLIRGMIKHPHGLDAESGNAYLILDVLAPIADLSEYQVFSGPTGGSIFGGSLVSWTSPSSLPSGAYSAGDQLLLVQGASGTVEASAAVIEQFYSTCGSNAHVVYWDAPASEAPSFYLAGTTTFHLTPIMLLRGDSVVDMLGDFFVDEDENLRVVDFLYPGVGGLGFQEGFVTRVGDSNSVDFDLSDWALSDCACAVSWYGSCEFSYSDVIAAENLPCPSPVCGDVGCTDETSCNYDPTATIPNNSCEYIDALGECGGTCVDADGDGECDREMIIRGLMNLPIHDDYIGSPGFIHLEAVQDVASLSDFGLSNVTYDSWTDGFDICSATPSPLALPDIPLNAGEHVLVAYNDYGEYAEQNSTRLNEYLGEAQALFKDVIFPEYDGNDDWQSQASIDHMVLWKGNQLLDGFGAIPLCANGYPQLTWPLPGASGAVYDVFSECHRWIYRQNVTPGPWTFSESDWWFNQCNTGVCNVVGPATAGNFCFNGTTPEHYPFLFQGCMDPGACNYDASVFIENGTCAYFDADGDGVCDENEVPGCTNPEACNYNVEATEEDGSCLDPTLYDSGTCQCFNDLNFNGVCDELESVGCTNSGACNYDPLADLDNGTCVYAAAGFDCSGECTLLDADSTCLNAIEYVCEQHSVIAAEGDIYGGMPEDIPAFYGVTDQSDLSMWGATPTSPWLDSHPTQTEINNNLGAIFSGAWGATVLVDTAGTIMNPGEINAYGIFLPPMQNVVKVDNGEFQVLVLDEDGDVTSFAFDEGGSSFSPPFDVVLADIVDIACTMENNVAVDSEGEIHVWGAPWTIAELGYGMPTDMIGNWVAVDGTWSELVGVTDAGDAAIWPYDPSLTDHWKTLFNAYDWVADPAVDARISQNWACVLTQSGVLIHFSSDSLLWNETTYEDLMPPASFGPVVDFDISTTGLIAKNANGQVHSAFSPTYSAEGETWWLESADFASSVPAVEFADPLCIPGCTDMLASNYSPAANLEDGNCLYEGCTDPTAFNYDPDAVDDDGSCITSGCVDEEACNYSAQAIYGLRLETVAVHEGMVGTADLTGFTTYRLHVDLPDSADFVSAIYGNDQDTLSLFSTGEFYQNVLGGVTPNGINPILFSAFPELEFDSWVTIGLEGVPGPGQQIISTVEDASAPWVFPFETGNGFEINTLTGGSWYIINNGSASNGVAGADRSVLLGQFTTNGELYGELQIQYFPGGDGSNFEILSLPLENACSYAEPFYDCLGACLLDQDGDGICDELEVPGCMHPEACNFDPSATDEDGSCRISAATASIELEMVTEHNGMVGTDNLEGLTTYRLYATVDQPEDQVMAVYGDAANALAIQSTGSFWQHPLGGITADGIQPALLGSFPGLAFDSYVTIGTTQLTLGNGVIELAESSDPVDQWLPAFIAGEDIQVSSVTGGGWYVVPGLEPYLNTLPDDSGRVLLGQFTTEGLMYGQLNLQIEACGVGTVQLVDLDFGASPELIGCTDPLACNFSEPAVEDDGSCCYAGCLEVYSEEVVLVDRQTGDTLVSVDRFDGTREFCLEDGCYVVSSAPGDSLNLNGEAFSMEFETLAISVGDVLCDGCKNERACNYAPEAIFDNGECALLPGDLDNPANGNVGISDLLFLLSEFGCNSDCSADVNGDGHVGATDLLDMLGTFGDSCETVFMGCTDPSACNYDALNVLNDGSCTYPDGEGNCD